MFKTVVDACLGSSVLAMFAACATAGTINLNNEYNGGDPFISDSHMFVDVEEVNGPPNEPAINFYQDPITIGNSLIVNPVNFRVDITPGPGLDAIDSQLEMIILGNEIGDGELATIPAIGLIEEGDYDVFGDASSFVRAELNWFWQVLEGTSAGAKGNGSVMFEAGSAESGIWRLTFEDELPAGTTKLRFEFDNRITGFAAGDLSLASISKKTIPGIRIVVPEPVSCWLTLSGLLIFLGLVRRDNA